MLRAEPLAQSVPHASEALRWSVVVPPSLLTRRRTPRGGGVPGRRWRRRRARAARHPHARWWRVAGNWSTGDGGRGYPGRVRSARLLDPKREADELRGGLEPGGAADAALHAAARQRRGRRHAAGHLGLAVPERQAAVPGARFLLGRHAHARRRAAVRGHAAGHGGGAGGGVRDGVDPRGS